MKRFLVASVFAALALGTVPTGAVPIPGGCAAVTVGAGSTNCSYIATGPATYVGASPSGFLIKVVKPDGEVRLQISQVFGGCKIHAPLPIYGTMASEAGDTVTISIRTACYTTTIQPIPNPLPSPFNDPAAIPPEPTTVGGTIQVGFAAATEGP